MKLSLALLSVVPASLAATLLGAVAFAQPAPPVPGRWYRLQTVFRGANECFEGNQAASPVHGGAAFMDRCQNVSGQLWRLVPEGNSFRLRTSFRGDGECLEGNESGSPVHGGASFMDSCQNVSGQLWNLVPVGAPAAARPAPAPAAAPSERPDHRCGPAFGNARCAPGRCCSTHAWCGGPQETHCSTDHGFNGQFDGR